MATKKTTKSSKATKVKASKASTAAKKPAKKVAAKAKHIKAASAPAKKAPTKKPVVIAKRESSILLFMIILACLIFIGWNDQWLLPDLFKFVWLTSDLLERGSGAPRCTHSSSSAIWSAASFLFFGGICKSGSV